MFLFLHIHNLPINYVYLLIEREKALLFVGLILDKDIILKHV